MLRNVLLDDCREMTIRQKSLYSTVRFLSNQITSATFYLYEDWASSRFLQELNIEPRSLKAEQRELLRSVGISDKVIYGGYDKSMPKLVYLLKHEYAVHKNEAGYLPVRNIKNDFILSNSDLLNKAALEEQGINANTAVLCLAAAGLELMLPNVSFDKYADEEVQALKDIFTEEREDYLAAITRLADESYERLVSSDLDEIMIWAKNEAVFKIAPKAKNLENAVFKADKKTLRKAGASFFKSGVPVIGQAYISGGLIAASQVAATELIRVICDVLAKKADDRNLPEIAYALKLSEALS